MTGKYRPEGKKGMGSGEISGQTLSGVFPAADETEGF
jgi:hypothetical protein